MDNKTFIITGDLKVIVMDWKTNTRIIIQNFDSKSFSYMDIDKWTEFKKNIYAIDEEFHKRFNYQYPDL